MYNDVSSPVPSSSVTSPPRPPRHACSDQVGQGSSGHASQGGSTGSGGGGSAASGGGCDREYD